MISPWLFAARLYIRDIRLLSQVYYCKVSLSRMQIVCVYIQTSLLIHSSESGLSLELNFFLPLLPCTMKLSFVHREKKIGETFWCSIYGVLKRSILLHASNARKYYSIVKFLFLFVTRIYTEATHRIFHYNGNTKRPVFDTIK